MTEIRNIANKLVCRVDKSKKSVQIVAKGYRTTITFLDNGEVKVINAIN